MPRRPCGDCTTEMPAGDPDRYCRLMACGDKDARYRCRDITPCDPVRKRAHCQTCGGTGWNTSVLTDAQTRILHALMVVYIANGRATVRDVAREAGRTVSPTYAQLQGLIHIGLVEWDGSAGTMRPGAVG